jgi:tetratricopeptide (TPR) repeat protein
MLYLLVDLGGFSQLNKVYPETGARILKEVSTALDNAGCVDSMHSGGYVLSSFDGTDETHHHRMVEAGSRVLESLAEYTEDLLGYTLFSTVMDPELSRDVYDDVLREYRKVTRDKAFVISAAAESVFRSYADLEPDGDYYVLNGLRTEPPSSITRLGWLVEDEERIEALLDEITDHLNGELRDTAIVVFGLPEAGLEQVLEQAMLRFSGLNSLSDFPVFRGRGSNNPDVFEDLRKECERMAEYQSGTGTETESGNGPRNGKEGGRYKSWDLSDTEETRLVSSLIFTAGLRLDGMEQAGAPPVVIVEYPEEMTDRAAGVLSAIVNGLSRARWVLPVIVSRYGNSGKLDLRMDTSAVYLPPPRHPGQPVETPVGTPVAAPASAFDETETRFSVESCPGLEHDKYRPVEWYPRWFLAHRCIDSGVYAEALYLAGIMEGVLGKDGFLKVATAVSKEKHKTPFLVSDLERYGIIRWRDSLVCIPGPWADTDLLGLDSDRIQDIRKLALDALLHLILNRKLSLSYRVVRCLSTLDQSGKADNVIQLYIRCLQDARRHAEVQDIQSWSVTSELYAAQGTLSQELEKARYALSRGDNDNAFSLAKQIVHTAQSSDDQEMVVEAHIVFGRTFLRLSRVRQAWRHFGIAAEKALSVRRKRCRAEALILKGAAAFLLGEYIDLKMILNEVSSHPEILPHRDLVLAAESLKMRYLMEMGWYEDAGVAAERACNDARILSCHDGARRFLAWSARAMALDGDPDRAVAVLSREPVLFETRLFLLEAYILSGRYGEALELLSDEKQEYPVVSQTWTGYPEFSGFSVAEGLTESPQDTQTPKRWEWTLGIIVRAALGITRENDPAELESFARSLGSSPADPSAHLYHFALAKVLELTQPENTAGRSAVLGRALKILRFRAGNLQNSDEMRGYLESHLYNRLLLQEARRFNLT